RCRESDLHLMVQPLDIASKEMPRDVSMLVRQLRLEGAILLPPLSDHPVVRAALAEAGVPAVHIAPMREPVDSPSVDTDDRAAARQMTVQLLEHGHRRIGFMLGPPGHRATEQRYLGFADAMHARAVSIDPELVQTGNFEFADGLECARRILAARWRPTAIFASNDDMAAAAACVARQIGLELPGELSVAGFDDAPVASMIWPQLATVRQPVREIARLAAADPAPAPRARAGDAWLDRCRIVQASLTSGCRAAQPVFRDAAGAGEAEPPDAKWLSCVGAARISRSTSARRASITGQARANAASSMSGSREAGSSPSPSRMKNQERSVKSSRGPGRM